MADAAENQDAVDSAIESSGAEEQTTDNAEESADILSISDAELDSYFENAQNNEGGDEDGETDNDGGSVADAEETDSGNQASTDDDADGSEDEEDEQGDEEFNEDGTSKLIHSDEEEDDDADSEEEEDSSENESEEEETDKETSESDYEAQIKKLLSPFKANGRDIKVNSVDDAITLMRMGANYNKKMASLKPSLKIVKMLQQNDLLDEAQISHLIDVSKKDPQAIAKLLKDGDIDPMDLNTKEAGDYKPTDHRVSDSQIDLDEAVDSIRDNESFPRTIDTISNKWDSQSKDIILNEPKIIPVIDGHIQSGIFDKIVTEMEREKILGRLEGVPDIVAYKQIGDRLQKAGELVPNQDSNAAGKTGETKKPAAKKKAEAKRTQKRKAAAATKSSTAKKGNSEFDPLSMPDDEFNKIAGDGLYS